MALLEISLLGRFQIIYAGEPVLDFKADSARALLAYLAVHAGTPLRRDLLAGLLWPEQSNHLALQSLRKVIGDRDVEPSFLNITRKELCFNSHSTSPVRRQSNQGFALPSR